MKEKHIPTEYEIKTKSNREPIGIILGLPAEKIASDDLAKLMRTPRSLMYIGEKREAQLYAAREYDIFNLFPQTTCNRDFTRKPEK